MIERQGRSNEHALGTEVLCKIPVFRPVAIKLLSLLTSEEADVFEVTGLLNSDPGFSAEVLTLANSAAYSLPNRVNTVVRAVLVLGLERTRKLVTRASLQGMVRGMGESAAMQNCWMHSRAAAALATWLSPYYHVHPEQAYTEALMHDIGRLGLLSAHGSRYADLLGRITGTNENLMDAERMLFLVDHCQAGAWLTRTWSLPPEFQESSANHHKPVAGTLRDHTDVTACACALAQSLGFRAAPLIEAEPAEAILERVPNAMSPRLNLDLSDLSNQIRSEISM
jgi:HD-like signal output (HDOD) protein